MRNISIKVVISTVLILSAFATTGNATTVKPPPQPKPIKVVCSAETYPDEDSGRPSAAVKATIEFSEFPNKPLSLKIETLGQIVTGVIANCSFDVSNDDDDMVSTDCKSVAPMANIPSLSAITIDLGNNDPAVEDDQPTQVVFGKTEKGKWAGIVYVKDFAYGVIKKCKFKK